MTASVENPCPHCLHGRASLEAACVNCGWGPDTTTAPPQPQPSNQLEGCLLAILGAIISNAIVFGLAFTWGAIFGLSAPTHSPTGQSEPVEFGFKGGMIGVFLVVLVYAGCYGLIPLAISLIGAAIGASFRNRKRR